MTLDIATTNPVSGSGNDSRTSFDRSPVSCGASSARWHCAVTQPVREHLAACELRAAGWRVYLPLHLERPIGHPERNRIVPLFRRYCFVAFGPNDWWGLINRTRGVVSLISHGIGQPTPLPVGVVEDLIARTSQRGVVDDMPDATTQRPPQAGRGVWRNIGALSADERLAVLQRLFTGQVAA